MAEVAEREEKATLLASSGSGLNEEDF